MQMNNDLTQVQAETLRFIAGYVKRHGYSPTIAEMAEEARVNGNAISGQLAVLLKKGAITKTAGIPRSIRPVTQP
jgi:repressor LexA